MKHKCPDCGAEMDCVKLSDPPKIAAGGGHQERVWNFGVTLACLDGAVWDRDTYFLCPYPENHAGWRKFTVTVILPPAKETIPEMSPLERLIVSLANEVGYFPDPDEAKVIANWINANEELEIEPNEDGEPLLLIAEYLDRYYSDDLDSKHNPA
jgi:hypothetical protein